MNSLKCCLLWVGLFITVSASAQSKYPGYVMLPAPDSLVKTVGSKVNVFGMVFNGNHLPQQKKTFLYIGAEFPNHGLTVVIKDKDRGKFKQPLETYYYEKLVTISGIIESKQGKLQIQVKDTSQISVVIPTRVNY
ncbi:hypothetical protein HH214_04925 [Mucilaginibacter robiniae]|uniref:DUF4369 domain-containing protein n=1 Tax=Mucilaginibacter robiniae TaxID=2728022 RepID=A0A7L5E144_9SPHI|nr:hypothetical protein [Mucilaginibacter robiniae]QJD95264.1 hypothetical protein HH214_04925 [Mucilaginibacter robiniae]